MHLLGARGARAFAWSEGRAEAETSQEAEPIASV